LGEICQAGYTGRFSKHKIEEAGLIDVKLVKFWPTWRNNRIGEAGVSKRLNRFFIPGTLLNEIDTTRS
jgi:hypothetical protein